MTGSRSTPGVGRLPLLYVEDFGPGGTAGGRTRGNRCGIGLSLVAGRRTTTTTGNAMAPIALAFAVLDVTSSVTSLGIVVAARSVANVVFLLWGGVVRQLVLVGSCAVSAASQALIAVLVLQGTASVPFPRPCPRTEDLCESLRS